MNILQVQDRLKGLSEQQLAQEMQMPSGMAPQYLVLTELQRRKRVRDDFQAQSAQAPTTTVAQDAVAAAGVPQAGIAPMAQALAPKTDVTQNTGIAALAPQAAPEPQRMAGGGMVRKFAGGKAIYTDPALVSMANKRGMTVEKFLETLSPEARASWVGASERNAAAAPMLKTEPPASLAGEDFTPVNPSYVEQTQSVFPDDSVPPMNPPAIAPQPLYGAVPAPIGMGAGPAPETPMSLDALAAKRPKPRPMSTYDAIVYGQPFDTLPEDQQALANQRTETIGAIGEAVGDYTVDPLSAGWNYLQGAGADVASGLSYLVPGMEKFSMDTDKLADQYYATADKTWNDGVDPMYAEAQKSAEDAAALRDNAGITESLHNQDEKAAAADAAKEALRTANEDAATTSAAETPQGGSGSVSASFSSSQSGPQSDYEKALADALARTDKRAKQDMWLSVAQAGMALMSSKQPTLGGAIGEAGIMGLNQYRDTRDAAEKTKMDILGTQYEIDMAKQKMAMARAAAASGGRGAGGKPIPAALVKLLEEKRTATADALQQLPPPTEHWFSGPTDDNAQERLRLQTELQNLDTQLMYAWAQYNSPYSLTDEEEANLADE